MKLKFWKRDDVPNCECEEYCSCKDSKKVQCDDCDYYKMIDSGYGTCIALPQVVIVPWCRIICSLFHKR